MNFFRKVATSSLWLMLAISMLILCHNFYQFIGNAPYLAADDSLANVAVILAYFHHYGSFVNPVQAFISTLRIDNFFNYGPMPFLFGALLLWLFGVSYIVIRSIHLLGIILICFAALFNFYRSSLATVGLFALTLIYMFWHNQWPMFRPDIIVALFAAWLIFALTQALETDKLIYWFLAGFFAMSAATTHQIAWALVPASFLMWLLVKGFNKSPFFCTTQHGRYYTLACLILGYCIGALIFLLAIHFDFFQLLQLWHSYASYAATNPNNQFVQVLLHHWKLTWFDNERLMFATVALVFIAILILILAYYHNHKQVITLLLPPLLISLSYILSLGFYNNFHIGYTLTNQVSVIWLFADLIAVLIVFLAHYWEKLAFHLETALQLIIAVLLFYYSVTTLTDNQWSLIARDYVNYTDYIEHVISPLPYGANALGDLIFGLDSGRRINLLQVDDGLYLAAQFTPAVRPWLAPDFLIFNQYLNISSLEIVREKVQNYQEKPNYSNMLEDLQKIFANKNYSLVNIVDATPYGSTEVFAKEGLDNRGEYLPEVSIYNTSKQQWSSNLSAPLNVHFQLAQAASFNLTFALHDYTALGYQLTSGTHVSAKADRTYKAVLPTGIYLIKIKLIHRDLDKPGLLLATDKLENTATAGDIGFNIAQTPYFSRANYTYILIHHQLGPLYISQFDADPAASLFVSSVQVVLTLSGSNTRVNPIVNNLLAKITPSKLHNVYAALLAQCSRENKDKNVACLDSSNKSSK